MLSILCDAGRRVGTLRKQPAVYAINTKLILHLLVHDSNLSNQFPGFGYEYLQMRNPQSPTSFFALKQIHERLINATSGKRTVYIKRSLLTFLLRTVFVK